MRKSIVSILLLMTLLMIQPLSVEAVSMDNSKVYSLIVDRFMNGTENNNKDIHNEKDDRLPYGGDFQGIKSKLEYIKDMGFDTILISPVFTHEKHDYLGYKVKDYKTIDKTFGGEKDLKQLIKSVHQNNMKIIVDMPMVATDGFTSSDKPVMNALQKEYFEGQHIIDMNNPENQALYKKAMTDFVDRFNVDGLSIYSMQDHLDAKKIFPDIKTIVHLNKGMTSEHFDYIQKEETTLALANAFKTTDQKIPGTYEKNELLSSDSFFNQRFTKYAADENKFPGTRIKQLMSYLLIQKQPISMTYGTEIAMNGEKMPEMHQLLDFRTDKEVIDYLKTTSEVIKKYNEMYDGTSRLIENKNGSQVIFFDTDKVDFIYNMNNTSKATNITLDKTVVPEGKMLSGLLIGDSIHEKNGKFSLITNREESELYAIIPARGLNIGYFIAAASIVILFTTFIVLVAKKSRQSRA